MGEERFRVLTKVMVVCRTWFKKRFRGEWAQGFDESDDGGLTKVMVVCRQVWVQGL